MATTLILRAARARHRQMIVDLAADLRRARFECGVSQRALAAAAGVDHGDLSRIEAGKRVPSLAVVNALATALGLEASLRLYPTVGPRVHDRVSAPIADALLGIAHPRWSPRLEVFVLAPSKGVIDIVLSERTASDVVATEIQAQLRRVEQQLRWAGQKADSLPSAKDWPWTVGPPRISRLLLLRSTADNRALVGGLPELFRAAYPAAEEEAFRALTAPDGLWPGHAMLWAEVVGGRARILDAAPRGAGR